MKIGMPILEKITENNQAASIAVKIHSLGLRTIESADHKNRTTDTTLLKRYTAEKLSSLSFESHDEEASKTVLKLLAQIHSMQE